MEVSETWGFLERDPLRVPGSIKGLGFRVSSFRKLEVPLFWDPYNKDPTI